MDGATRMMNDLNIINNQEEDILQSEKRSGVCRSAINNLDKTLGAQDGTGVFLKGPITPAFNRESDAHRSPVTSIPEPGHSGSQLEDDGCSTPRESVFDPFAPCQTCPPTPGPVIRQRIRLW